MNKLKIKVGFIGYGKMGAALAAGAMNGGVISPSKIFAYDPAAVPRAAIRKQRIKMSDNIPDLIVKSDLVFLCVKPQQMSEVLQDARRETLRSAQRKCIASIAAGVTLERLEKGLGKNVAMIRIMPNTPALLGHGMSAFARGPGATVRHVSWVRTILSSVGEVAEIKEKDMNLVTALSGSGPAYGFYLAEAMIQAGQKMGLKKDLCRKMVHQTLYGAGAMLNERPESAAELRQYVTSPGGTTAAAISEFERHKFRKIVRLALERAANRSKELSQLE